MKNGFWGGIKDKILKAADVDEENENMYDESDEYDEYEDDDVYSEDEKSIDSKVNYSFGYASADYSSKSDQNHSPFGATEHGGGNNEKFTRKANSNIYQMNNTPVLKVNRVVYFLLEDTADARNIADCMKAEDSVILAELSKLSDIDSQCVLNFIDGVRYIFDSHIEMLGHDVYLIVPKTIELAGDFNDQLPGVFF